MNDSPSAYSTLRLLHAPEREEGRGGRGGEREKGKEGGRERGGEGGREGERERGREGEGERERKGGREGGGQVYESHKYCISGISNVRVHVHSCILYLYSPSYCHINT